MLRRIQDKYFPYVEVLLACVFLLVSNVLLQVSPCFLVHVTVKQWAARALGLPLPRQEDVRLSDPPLLVDLASCELCSGVRRLRGT